MPRDKQTQTPTPEQLRQTISQSSTSLAEAQRNFEENFSRDANMAEFEYIHLIGLEDHYIQKSFWSKSILFLMFLMIIYQSLLLGMVGAGHWSFKDYQWLLPALLAQNLAQVVGLAVIVVKSLFADITTIMPHSRRT